MMASTSFGFAFPFFTATTSGLLDNDSNRTGNALVFDDFITKPWVSLLSSISKPTILFSSG
ncbi:MAG: hypothetical protein R2825_19735 [Saprospiraceae bacterium]